MEYFRHLARKMSYNPGIQEKSYAPFMQPCNHWKFGRLDVIQIKPIASVHNARVEVEDDDWGSVISVIELDPSLPEEALHGIETFSHAEILFHFHLVPESKIETGTRHPRNNTDWPKVGILSQRGKNRPNRLGSALVRILRREGRQLHVSGLDAVDGTPILDIKPVMREFLPREEVHQPDWAAELMKHYWKKEQT
jgi:tRNA-Thr(GGU) m(6)t(6)A37 methyltransferase TsaA